MESWDLNGECPLHQMEYYVAIKNDFLSFLNTVGICWWRQLEKAERMWFPHEWICGSGERETLFTVRHSYSVNFICHIFLSYITCLKNTGLEHLAGSVRRARGSQSWGREFESHVGGRLHLKKKSGLVTWQRIFPSFCIFPKWAFFKWREYRRHLAPFQFSKKYTGL